MVDENVARVLLRVPSEILADVDRFARETRRSRNAAILVLLEEALRHTKPARRSDRKQ